MSLFLRGVLAPGLVLCTFYRGGSIMQLVMQPNKENIKTRSASRFVVALVMVLLVAVSSSWSACVKERFTFTRSSYNCDECGSAPNCSTPIEAGGYFRLGGREISTPQCLYLDAFTWDCPSRHYWITGVECEYTYRCKTQVEADSLAHIINCQNNPSDPSCKIDTVYHCQNMGGSSPGGIGGAPQKALIYQCIGDVCTQQQVLAGSCQEWGYCDKSSSDCDITDSTGRVPCTRSGDGSSTNGKCYYQCGNGKNYVCNSKYSTWAGGSVYVGSCPDYPDCVTDIAKDTTSGDNPYNVGGNVKDSTISRDTSSWGDNGSGESQLDYYPILDSILDTLTMVLRNARSQTYSQETISNLLSTTFQNDLDIIADNSNKEKTLVGDIADDLGSSRLLLDSIKMLMGDTLIVKTVPASVDSSISQDSSWAEKIFDWVRGAFGSSADSSSTSRDCNALLKSANSCIAQGGNALECRKNYMDNCLEGGSPLESQFEGAVSILGRILDYMTGEDSSAVDTSVTVDSSALSRVQEMLSRLDSIPDFNLDSLKSSLQERLDSASRIDTLSMNTDSLFTDTASIRQRFQGSGIFLPGGTNSSCYVCRAELGTFGGLSDTSMVLEIDFSNFGGYNWCELIRTVIRIATLVVIISLTIGSFAAAFGWNKSTGE